MSRAIAVAFAMSVLGAGITSAEDGMIDPCVKECRHCQTLCQACAASCLEELSQDGGRKACIKLCQDCADICGACANIGSRSGPLEAHIAAACAEACERCAAECGKHKDDKSCQACADQCKRCAQECKNQAKKN